MLYQNKIYANEVWYSE